MTQSRSSGDMKLLLFLGDSVDLLMVDDWCEHYNASGAQLYFANSKNKMFWWFSDMGHMDQKFHDLMSTSGVLSWKWWQGRICIRPDKGVAVAFVFNVKGVAEHPPWWLNMEQEICRSKDLSKEGSRPECHDFPSFLSPAVKAITTFLKVEPQTTVLSSNLWDCARLQSNHNVSWAEFEKEDIQNDWKRNATKLVQAVRGILPNSKLVWHTVPVGAEENPDFLHQTIPGQIHKSPMRLEKVLSSPHHPGSHKAIAALNKVAHSLVEEENIELEAMDEIPDVKYRDLFLHPTKKVLVKFLDDLVQKTLDGPSGRCWAQARNGKLPDLGSAAWHPFLLAMYLLPVIMN